MGSLEANAGTKLRVQDVYGGNLLKERGRCRIGLGKKWMKGNCGAGSTKLWPTWQQLWGQCCPQGSRVRWEGPAFLLSPHSGPGCGLPPGVTGGEWRTCSTGGWRLCADGVLCCRAASRIQAVQTVSTLGVQRPWFCTSHWVNLSETQPFWAHFLFLSKNGLGLNDI